MSASNTSRENSKKEKSLSSPPAPETPPVSLIQVRFASARGWEADEGEGMCSYFLTKKEAVEYGTQRIAYHRGELRIFSEAGVLERTIAFNERA